ncbi:mitochondrial small ribosomal subunit Rsm22-domain-containing protein [Cytidiella melzeri]|nr:mitochondrial small ribosomal subunit Rsm22-domain-containing protein [Cytidiella melzeri]
MLRSLSRSHAVAVHQTRKLSTSKVLRSQVPNARLEVGPSFEEFMKNASDMGSWKAHSETPRRAARELEVYPDDPLATQDYLSFEELDLMDTAEDKHTRKSPAARFGSQRHGTILLPLELQGAVTKLISGSDKPMLHVDAKRLFLDDSNDEAQWNPSYDVRYKSRRQAHQHAERDGTAFASVALPSHYAAIFAVLDHVKQRLGPNWTAQHVIDWGSGTGSGLWAATQVFQNPSTTETLGLGGDVQIANSTIKTYLGLDKREGLVSIGRRLLKDVNLGELEVTWKQAFKESNKVPYTEGNGVLAISAFMLSSLQTPLARKTLVTQMWESGADTIVIIDHSTSAGFESIAEARANILRMGTKQIEDPETDCKSTTGCHVLAPCPHDHACPLHHPGSKRLLCGFSQRLQRPEFLRKTKHSGQGHEDTGYSYVVIRRGPRPSPADQQVGRVGDVGKRELQKFIAQNKPVVELTIDGEHHLETPPTSIAANADSFNALHQANAVEQNALQMSHSSREMDEALRSEAYHWPRLVFPPLKKSGHIILDGCTAEGKIMRMTIPKSQGKQPFYDARKSGWGDIFPHAPKNRPQEKHLPPGPKFASETTLTKASDRGKRIQHDDRKHKSYSRLAEELNEHKKKVRQQKQFTARNGRAEF